MSPSDAFYEREYNARASIPDHPRIFADWADRSARPRTALLGLPDVAYSPGPARGCGSMRLSSAATANRFIWRAIQQVDI